MVKLPVKCDECGRERYHYGSCQCAAGIAASLPESQRTILREIASGEKIYTRAIWLFDDGLVQKRMRGVITNYRELPLELTELGHAVLNELQRSKPK